MSIVESTLDEVEYRLSIVALDRFARVVESARETTETQTAINALASSSNGVYFRAPYTAPEADTLAIDTTAREVAARHVAGRKGACVVLIQREQPGRMWEQTNARILT